MELKDLFVSYKLVDPPKIIKKLMPKIPDIYINLNRIQKATDNFSNPENINDGSYYTDYNNSDMSTWSVKSRGEGESNNMNDVKQSYRKSIYTPKGHITKKWDNVYNNGTSHMNWAGDMVLAYKKLGLSDNAIKNLISKNALESKWGESALGAYNFGNIIAGKSWKGNYVLGSDKDKNGNSISANFRSYDSIDEFVKDELQLLKTLYDFDEDDSIDVFVSKLTGGNKNGYHYAVSPSYADDVKWLYNNGTIWKKLGLKLEN